MRVEKSLVVDLPHASIVTGRLRGWRTQNVRLRPRGPENQRTTELLHGGHRPGVRHSGGGVLIPPGDGPPSGSARDSGDTVTRFSQLVQAPRHNHLRRSAGTAGSLGRDRKSTRLNSSHLGISYAVFCLKKKKTPQKRCAKSSPPRDIAIAFRGGT